MNVYKNPRVNLITKEKLAFTKMRNKLRCPLSFFFSIILQVLADKKKKARKNQKVFLLGRRKGNCLCSQMAQLCTNYDRIKNRDEALEVVSGYVKAAGYKATYRTAALPYTSKEKCRKVHMKCGTIPFSLASVRMKYFGMKSNKICTRSK